MFVFHFTKTKGVENDAMKYASEKFNMDVIPISSAKWRIAYSSNTCNSLKSTGRSNLEGNETSKSNVAIIHKEKLEFNNNYSTKSATKKLPYCQAC